MITHGIEVSNRTIGYCQAVDNIVAGGVNSDELAVTFDGEWEGLSCKCVFMNGDSSATVAFEVIDGAATITVPTAAIAEPGHLFLTFVGTDDDVTIKTRMMANSIPVVESGRSTSIDREPTPDEIEHMISLVDEALSYAKRAVEVAEGGEDVRNASFQELVQAFTDAQSANDAAQAENDRQQAANNDDQNLNNDSQASNDIAQSSNNDAQASNNAAQISNDSKASEAIAEIKAMKNDYGVVSVDEARATITEMFAEVDNG